MLCGWALWWCSEGRRIPESLHLPAEEKYADLIEELLERCGGGVGGGCGGCV